MPMPRRRVVAAALAVLGAAAALPLAACVAPPQGPTPPEVGLRDVRFLEAGLLEQEVALLLSVTNPNTRDLGLSGLRVALEMNGAPLARGYASERLTIPRLSTITVPVRARVNSLDLVRQIMALGKREGVDYLLHGDAILGRADDGRAVPFRTSGSLDVAPGGGAATTLTPR